ncbi:NADP-dependent oxidoreductase [Streptantibioticus silvisoli]|uniref:NADP-dependent oxidoreductase n=1 Tax=Streptantibioticus silvisoli TaxID=2705255 RepID=A0ABT6VUZ9_9ACTN|nr:NADP-dependent oxidoreductase [Streptantibioticus silvisoli]MDI5962303.1 NADP-dependent oxidoreductase [Streptantibioticus silvisoli]
MARAVRFDEYGDRDVLYVEDVEVPRPAAGEVVVRVEAAGINPGEAAVRQGAMREMFPATFPSGQGSDLAGVVSAVGDGVTRFAAGDEVLGWSVRRSSQAEYAAVPVSQLIAKPPGLGWEVAGSLYVVGCTAYAAVRAVGAGKGDTVVVSAAAGGVGSVVTQLLRTRGVTVVGIASPSNHGWLAEHGAVPVAYGDGLAERLKAAAPQGIDAFIDLFGPQYLRLAVDLGVPRDRIETIISFAEAAELGTRAEGSVDASDTGVLAEMAALAASGDIEIPIAATYPLDRVRDAYAELEQRHTRGKIVLLP